MQLGLLEGERELAEVITVDSEINSMGELLGTSGKLGASVGIPAAVGSAAAFGAWILGGLMSLYEEDAVFPTPHGTSTGLDEIRATLDITAAAIADPSAHVCVLRDTATWRFITSA